MSMGIAEPPSTTDPTYPPEFDAWAEPSVLLAEPQLYPHPTETQPSVTLAEPSFETGDLRVVPGGNLHPAYRAAKRTLDVVGAAAILILLAPVMLTVLLVLLITTKGKPLFSQRRAGYCGRPFPMVKFRTMAPDADRRQHEVQNEQQGPVFKNRRDPRITRIGRWLRKTSLDETPQLFSVLLGHMSLVGPRPLPLKEVARFEPRHRSRLAVKPGLTCLWQVSGRSEIGFEDWMRLDIWYVRHQGLWTDLKLLLSTPASVISGRGAY